MKCCINFFHNQKGFTLIESLLSLYILTFVSSLIILLLSTLFFKTSVQSIQPFELENFVIQSQNEFREINDWKVEKNVIHMTTKFDEHITYSLYNKLIRRQVDNAGHEVLLQNVSTFTCSSFENGIKMTITDTNGKQFVRNIYRLGE